MSLVAASESETESESGGRKTPKPNGLSSSRQPVSPPRDHEPLRLPRGEVVPQVRVVARPICRDVAPRDERIGVVGQLGRRPRPAGREPVVRAAASAEEDGVRVPRVGGLSPSRPAARSRRRDDVARGRQGRRGRRRQQAGPFAVHWMGRSRGYRDRHRPQVNSNNMYSCRIESHGRQSSCPLTAQRVLQNPHERVSQKFYAAS